MSFIFNEHTVVLRGKTQKNLVALWQLVDQIIGARGIGNTGPLRPTIEGNKRPIGAGEGRVVYPHVEAIEQYIGFLSMKHTREQNQENKLFFQWMDSKIMAEAPPPPLHIAAAPRCAFRCCMA